MIGSSRKLLLFLSFVARIDESVHVRSHEEREATKSQVVVGKLDGKLKLRVDRSRQSKDNDENGLKREVLFRIQLGQQVAVRHGNHAHAPHDEAVKVVEDDGIAKVGGDDKVGRKEELHRKHAEESSRDL